VARLVLALLTSLAGLLLSLPVLLLGLPFWVMSAGVAFFARLTEPRLAERDELMQFDPVLGWKPRANVNTHYLIPRDDIYPIQTDAFGWPGRQALSDSELVVIGDSFAYGYGSRKGESFADMAPEVRIKSIACPGYDPVQEVLLLRELGDRLRGKLVVWFMYPENDLPDLTRPQWRQYRKPFVRRSATTGEWEVVSDHVRPGSWRPSIERDNFAAFAQLCLPGPLADRCYSACAYLLGEAAEICRGVEATLVVFTIPNVNQLEPSGRRRFASLTTDPRAFDAHYPDRQLGEICAKHGVPFVSGMTRFEPRDYKRFERFHWTPSGNRKVARLLHQLRDDWRLGHLGARAGGSIPSR
jgi:hypothetical protein